MGSQRHGSAPSDGGILDSHALIFGRARMKRAARVSAIELVDGLRMQLVGGEMRVRNACATDGEVL